MWTLKAEGARQEPGQKLKGPCASSTQLVKRNSLFWFTVAKLTVLGYLSLGFWP